MNGNQTKQEQPKKPSAAGETAKDLAKKTAGRVTKAGVKKAGEQVGKLAAGVGIKEVVSDAVASLGLATGPLAPIVSGILKAVSWVASWIADKILSKISTWIKRHKDEATVVGGVLFLGGIILGSLPVILIGGVLLFGGFLAAAGGVALATGLAGWFTAFILGITAPARAFALWLLIAIITVPILFAVIIFIINSSSYVVPEGPATFPSESQYIDVEKVAEPLGPFGNGELPERITYTITITAIRSTLTNINFEWTCRVLSDFGQTCPSYGDVTVNGVSQPNLLPPTPPQILSPTGDPYVITYSMLFRAGQFNDTATVDTFTVTADTEGVTGERASGSATVIFGNPPTACIDFEPTNAPYIGEFQAAAAELASNVSYAAKLCSAGPITARLNTEGPEASGACAGVTGSNTMFFNNCRYFRTHGQSFITYLFAHESGHLYAKRIPGDYSQFLTDNVPGEGHLPTYCISGQPPDWEDFAETIGDYVDNGRLGHLCAKPDERPFRLCGSRFTQHCDFARGVLFP